MNPEYPHLFKPLKVKNVVFRNRIFNAPSMMCMIQDDGAPGRQMIEYFARKGRGGAALVTVGDTPVEEDHGVGIPQHIILEDRNAPQLAEMASAIKEEGAVASLELNHAGLMAATEYGQKKNIQPFSSSAHTRFDGIPVNQMDEDMIEHVADCYADAASLLKKTGWDMCLIHGAHGWLIGQFFSPATNHRTDRFGGSFENRVRFPMMVVERVRQAVGKDFLIDYRISGDELQEGGTGINECIELLKRIEDKIDLVHVSAGLDTKIHQAIITHPNSYLPNGVNVKYAQAVKKSGIRLPVVAVGGITTPELAEEIISMGKADAVAMARTLIADPYWPQKVRKGQLNRIRHCIRCTNCLAEMQNTRQFHCDVNPVTGHEWRLDSSPPVSEFLNVYVAGGGPAGMTAAITAVQRGHRVTLFESADRLGGTLNYTDNDLKFKLDLNRFKEKLVAYVEELPITVRLNTPVTAEMIESQTPDYLILALGAEPLRPPVPGLDGKNVVTAFDAYIDSSRVKGKVAVIGGGLVGCECGIFLADLGHEVSIVEMGDSLSPDANMHHRTAVLEHLEKMTTTYPQTRCVEVTSDGITVEDNTRKQFQIEAETVILAAGYRPRKNPADTLRDSFYNFVEVGDCNKVFRVRGAVHEAYFAAMRLGV